LRIRTNIPSCNPSTHKNPKNVFPNTVLHQNVSVS
jgi:hypothetical protein